MVKKQFLIYAASLCSQWEWISARKLMLRYVIAIRYGQLASIR